jgi:lipoprotein-releasing system permease protein
MALLTVGLGILFAIIFLWGLDTYGGNIMPEVFIDRKIPIHISLRGILVSFGVPFLISSLFSERKCIKILNDVS